jgi:hypothetical protein
MGEPIGQALAAVAAVAGAVRLLVLRRAAVGTTLLAPWTWALMAMIAAGMIHSLPLFGVAVDDRLAYLAAAWTLCPFLALLGAKRPQDRGWQWIVIATAVVLSVPVGQSLAFGEADFALHTAWQWLVGALVVAQWINYAGTRSFGRATGVCVAQILWLGPFLSGARWESPSSGGLQIAGWAILVATLWLPVFPRRGSCRPLDRVWLDFRDTYGLLWARRVADRLNQTAELSEWPIRLDWSGWREVSVEEVISESDRTRAQKGVRTALRRFVSPEWIDRRLSVGG